MGSRKHYKLADLKAALVPTLHEEITDWYTVEEIVEKYGVTKKHIYDTVSERSIPKKRHGKTLLVSRFDWERVKKVEASTLEAYYTLDEITARYGVTAPDVRALAKRKGIPTVKQGRKTLYRKEQTDYYYSHKICPQPK